MLPRGVAPPDVLSQRILSWRCELWWENVESRAQGNYRRPVSGRPQGRWEDAFVAWRGSANWMAEMARDITSWKEAENDFVEFCLKWKKVRVGSVMSVKRENGMGAVDDAGLENVP